MLPALPVVRVTGWRKTGKTSVAVDLVTRLRARSYVVAALKHSHHPAQPDLDGSDTDRLARAGASPVLLAAADATVLRLPQPIDSLAEALRLLEGQADIVVAEGFKDERLGPVIQMEDGGESPLFRLQSETGESIAVARPAEMDRLVDAIEGLFALSAAGDEVLRDLVRRAGAAHGHICPGQVLGVRMALAGLRALDAWPPDSQRLHAYVEIDRCATDAIASVTGCSPGKRNLSILDYGKMAATFQDLTSGRAVRVIARECSREEAARWGAGGVDERHRQAIAYRRMPDDRLFDIGEVRVPLPDHEPTPRVICARCGEEISFGRYRGAADAPLCLPCAGEGRYYEHGTGRSGEHEHTDHAGTEGRPASIDRRVGVGSERTAEEA